MNYIRQKTREEYEADLPNDPAYDCPCDHWHFSQCETCKGACSCHWDEKSMNEENTYASIEKELYKLFVQTSPLVQIQVVKDNETVDIFEARISTLITKRFKLRERIKDWIEQQRNCGIMIFLMKEDGRQ